MISIITSLYRSDKYINNHIKNIDRVSRYLTINNTEHEFILIFNEPDVYENEIIKNLNNKENIKIIICPRENLYSTWNRGIKNSKYNNIAFWNVDDIRFGKAIINGLKKIQSQYELVYFPFIYKRYIRISGIKILIKIKIIPTVKYDQKLFIKHMYIGPFFITKKEVFDKIGLFDESYKIAGDFEFAVRAAKKNIKFTHDNTLAGIFTNDGQTLSGKKDELQKKENDKIVGKI